MPPYVASAPRAIVGILVFIVAVVLLVTHTMDVTEAGLFAAVGIGLMFA